MDERRDYDVVVVGAGPGGLSAAAYLSTTGLRVLVVDARDQVGGHMSAFSHDGFEFDIGLHYTSEVPVQRLLRPLGLDVAFREFDPQGMFRIQGVDHEIVVPKGREAFRDKLVEAFPAERETIEAFLATSHLLSEELNLLTERPHLRDLPTLPWRMRGLLRHGASTVGGYLDSLHVTPALKSAMLSWTSGSLGVPPAQASLPVSAMMVEGYLRGLSYPQGGSRVISEGLADVVRRHGGEVMLGTEVSRILVTNNRAHGVEVRDASLDAEPTTPREILAHSVVSAIDVQRTYLGLVPPDAVPGRLLRRVRGYELALPLGVVYLVLDRDLAAEGFRAATYMASESENIDDYYASLQAGDLPARGAVGIWIANLADPGNPRLCPPGQTNVQLIAPAPAQHEWWGVAPGSGSTARYAARRRELRDHLVRLAERVVPGLADSIVFEETGTPITEERLMRVNGGTSYGPALTPRQLMTRLGPASPVAGLFHAGAGVRPAHGLEGTLTGGLAAAATLTDTPAAELQAQTRAEVA